MVPVTLWIALFGAVLSAGAAIGALAAILIYGRGRAGQGALTCTHESFSLVTSRTVLTASTGQAAATGQAGRRRAGPVQAGQPTSQVQRRLPD